MQAWEFPDDQRPSQQRSRGTWAGSCHFYLPDQVQSITSGRENQSNSTEIHTPRLGNKSQHVTQTKASRKNLYYEIQF